MNISCRASEQLPKQSFCDSLAAAFTVPIRAPCCRCAPALAWRICTPQTTSHPATARTSSRATTTPAASRLHISRVRVSSPRNGPGWVAPPQSPAAPSCGCDRRHPTHLPPCAAAAVIRPSPPLAAASAADPEDSRHPCHSAAPAALGGHDMLLPGAEAGGAGALLEGVAHGGSGPQHPSPARGPRGRARGYLQEGLRPASSGDGCFVQR